MKIGIFTLAGSTNYGAALQTYALSEHLRQLGHKPEIVMIKREDGISRWRRLWGILTTYTFHEIISLILSDRVLKTQKIHSTYNATAIEVFHRFYTSYVILTDHIIQSQLPKYILKYDALIVGSDQVWTDLYSKTLLYFFDTFDDYNGLRISYAACSAHSKAAIYNRDKIRGLLDKFDAISVRDCITQKMARNYTKKLVSLVADPTLLIDFKNVCNEKPHVKPYIFCYILGEEPKGGGHNTAVAKIKEKVGNIDVIAINRTRNDYSSYFDLEMNESDPFTWVNLIYHAEAVYTDSFHAILFSLRYHKLLMAYYTETIRASRLVELRKHYALDGIVVDNLKKWRATNPDWSEIDKKICDLVKYSKDFLTQSLHDYE